MKITIKIDIDVKLQADIEKQAVRATGKRLQYLPAAYQVYKLARLTEKREVINYE